jgi:hypothetical protein
MSLDEITPHGGLNRRNLDHTANHILFWGVWSSLFFLGGLGIARAAVGR